MPALFLGVDGGGTKTKIIVIDQHKRVVGEAIVGGTNRNSSGDDAAFRNFKIGINAALDSVNQSKNKSKSCYSSASAADVKCACFAMSGCDTQLDVDVLREWGKQLLPNSRIVAVNDSVGGLASGTMGLLYGIVLISGTGMVAQGYNAYSDTPVRCGGFGTFVDDASGYGIACAGLKAAFHSFDETGPKTSLESAILETLQLRNCDQLLIWLYSRSENEWARIASLAPVITGEAAKGDEVAKAIVDRTARLLAHNVTTVARRLDFTTEEVPVVLIGGVLKDSHMRKAIIEQVRESLPNAKFIRPRVEPALGSALVAFNQLNPNTLLSKL